jgi:signal transduction histidine kinase
LCKEIVALYSGKSVSSEENKGTTVTFSLNLNLKK